MILILKAAFILLGAAVPAYAAIKRRSWRSIKNYME
jgi:hypothetical protein